MKKVLLGMSGGVDSSVAAIILKEQGYEVIGITMKLLEEDNNEDDAKKVCDTLGIKHYSVDFTEEFKVKVIQDFIKTYAESKTPNPCIECNKYLKFGLMYEKAKELGIEYIATGHYAKVEFDNKYGQNVLKKSESKSKDQSYVLYNISKEMLDKIIFPLDKFENKEEIRKIAEEHELVIANKPESEDICFIQNGNYKEFLEKNSVKQKPGDIILKNGKVLGKHNGLFNYTIGQRRGLGIAYEVPLFVIGFNKEKNQVIVGREEELYQKEIIVEKVNWLIDIKLPAKVSTKIRYSKKEAESTIEETQNGNIKVIFEEAQRAPTPGQSAVFYIDDVVLGGGKIV